MLTHFRCWIGYAAVGVGCGACFAWSASAESFPGWEGLRVIEQQGDPQRMYAADLDGDECDELIVVNFRNARLDLYAWKVHSDTPENDEAPPELSERTDSARDGPVNELPMAREIGLTEVPVRQPPMDAAVLAGLADNAIPTRLLVLVTDPNLLIELTPDADGNWAVSRQFDLLAGRPMGTGQLLHVESADDGSATVLISFKEGIQTLTIGPTSSATTSRSARWLEPRESLGRVDWWLADLDDDGRKDLVEWTKNNAQSLRWYPASPDGFRPAQKLHDRAVSMAAVLQRADAVDELLVLESTPEGVVRRYRLGVGETSPLGKREPLALPGGDGAVWTKLTIDGQAHLVVADPSQPRVTLYAHGPSGWTPGGSYPVSGKIQAMLELPAQPGSLVLRAEDSSDLLGSRWDGGRLTFPQPIGLADGSDDTQVMGFGLGVSDAWCVLKSGNDLLLHRIVALSNEAGGEHLSSSPVVRYADAAGKAEGVLMLDDARLLVADKFTKGLRFVQLVEFESGKALSTSPKTLARATLDGFRLYRSEATNGAEEITVGRVTDGVVQWLGDDLHAVDQVMLPDGRRIADLVLNADGSAWALQQSGTAIHRLEPDDAGLLRVAATTRLDAGGRSLIHDNKLGLLMQTGQGITRLAEGQPLELEVVQSLDARAGRPKSVRDATIHRVMTLDIDGDGQDDALLADDVRHQLTAMSVDGEGQLGALLSWPVFEDIAYPYGGGGDNQVREPRGVVALDLDGDGGQDLALLSQDRLLIYLANDPRNARQSQTETQP